jgi:hypothetical protein
VKCHHNIALFHMYRIGIGKNPRMKVVFRSLNPSVATTYANEVYTAMSLVENMSKNICIILRSKSNETVKLVYICTAITE